jgi:RNA polymerase primary sigma factor
LSGEKAIFQKIPADKLISWTNNEFDKLPAPNYQEFDQIELKIELEKSLKKLGQREREIIQMKYGLGGYEERTISEISKEFHLCRVRIHQILKQAKRKLKHPLISKHLKDYL